MDALLRSAPLSLSVVAASATFVIVAAAGWRMALLAALASGAVAATRIRFSRPGAVCLLALAAVATYATVGTA
jgi:hypothetical protein